MSDLVTATAHPNLALVKYWGKVDELLNIPTNSSLSINLGGATTITSVRFEPGLEQDRVSLNGQPADPGPAARVSHHLDWVRSMAGIDQQALVNSRNDFPTAAGIASSASAFAALSLAASQAAGLELDDRQLSILARKGSGSACRSIHGGYVEWMAGESDETSFAQQVAPPEHWGLQVVTVVLQREPKEISSTAGHRAVWTSPLFQARLETIPDTLDTVRRAVLERDFDALALAVEREAVSMHAIAMTGRLAGADCLSGLYYWRPGTMRLIRAVQDWRRTGMPVCFTIDAGPNMHLICPAEILSQLERSLAPHLSEMDATLIISHPGKGARITKALTSEVCQ